MTIFSIEYSREASETLACLNSHRPPPLHDAKYNSIELHSCSVRSDQHNNNNNNIIFEKIIKSYCRRRTSRRTQVVFVIIIIFKSFKFFFFFSFYNNLILYISDSSGSGNPIKTHTQLSGMWLLDIISFSLIAAPFNSDGSCRPTSCDGGRWWCAR